MISLRETIKHNSVAIASGTILTIILALLYKYKGGVEIDEKTFTEDISSQSSKYRDTITKDTATKDAKTNFANDELIQLSFIMKEFMKEIKESSESLVHFNNERKINSNYLNVRNHLFTKDIETTNILVDTNSVIGAGVKSDTNNYTIKLGTSGKYPREFKNVIGFRLIQCIIPVCLYHVKDGMNRFTIRSESDIPVILTPGNYSFDDLVIMINQMIVKAHPNYGLIKYVEQDFTVKFTSDDEENYVLIFENNNLHRLFGFVLEENNQIGPNSGKDIISENPIDKSIHYVDLVIPEIPHIACKLNSAGQNVIDRVPLVTEAGGLNYYETPFNEYFTQNYFYPIKLNELTIQLYEDSENNLYTTNGRDNYFEFEITILKNTKLMNN